MTPILAQGDPGPILVVVFCFFTGIGLILAAVAFCLRIFSRNSRRKVTASIVTITYGAISPGMIYLLLHNVWGGPGGVVYIAAAIPMMLGVVAARLASQTRNARL